MLRFKHLHNKAVVSSKKNVLSCFTHPDFFAQTGYVKRLWHRCWRSLCRIFSLHSFIASGLVLTLVHTYSVDLHG